MSLLGNLIGALTGQSSSDSGHPLQAAIGSLLERNGGLQGLMEKFQQGGMGDVFSSWVGMEENQSISAEQITSLLGSEQIQGIASGLGLDPSKASGFLAEYLPKLVDKLTPGGQVDPNGSATDGLAALMPSLLQSLTGDSGRA